MTMKKIFSWFLAIVVILIIGGAFFYLYKKSKSKPVVLPKLGKLKSKLLQPERANIDSPPRRARLRLKCVVPEMDPNPCRLTRPLLSYTKAGLLLKD